MRHFVLCLALSSAVVCVILGFQWKAEAQSPLRQQQAESTAEILAMQEVLGGEETPQLTEMRVSLALYQQRERNWYWWLATAGTCLLGGLLASERRRFLAILVLLPLPALMAWRLPISPVFTSGAFLAALLTLTIRTQQSKGKSKKAKKIVQSISRFACLGCRYVLRTRTPVPIGKKILCPNCERATPIRPINVGVKIVPITAHSKKAKKKKLASVA